ncbi:hypothetical protein ACV8AW_004450, partial [Escherichia coli]
MSSWAATIKRSQSASPVPALSLYAGNHWSTAKEILRTTEGTVAKLAMRQRFVLFKGLTFQKLCLPG